MNTLYHMNWVLQVNQNDEHDEQNHNILWKCKKHETVLIEQNVEPFQKDI